MSTPNESGALKGGGLRGTARRPSVIRGIKLRNQLPNVHISDRSAVRELPDFDPNLQFEYTQRELMLLTEKILLNDPKPWYDEPRWIPADVYLSRIRPREIFTANGTPDPAWVSGLYIRTHPEGRKFHEQEDRKGTKLGFYR